MMELRQLRYLQAIAEERNFTRAAEKMFVSQSALSQQIQTLEQEVGTILLDRSTRSVRLTAAGDILYQSAYRILHDIEQARLAIHELEGLKRGELCIGVVQTVNDYLMPAMIAHFVAHYPDIKLTIQELSTDEIEERLVEGELQVALGFIPPTHPSLDAYTLGEERLALIVRSDHALAHTSTIAVKHLDNMPLVMLTNSFCTRRLWEENARLVSASPRIVLEINSLAGLLSTVHNTGIATILPNHIAASHHNPALVSIELVDPVPSRQFGLLWNRDHYLCSASRAFIEIAKQVSEEMFRSPQSSLPHVASPVQK